MHEMQTLADSGLPVWRTHKRFNFTYWLADSTSGCDSSTSKVPFVAYQSAAPSDIETGI